MDKKDKYDFSPPTPEELAEFAQSKALETEMAETPSTSKSFERGLEQGATFGLSDEARGGIDALLSSFSEGEPESLVERYRKYRDLEREILRRAQEEHPYASMAGGLIGGLAVPIPGAGLKGAVGLAKAVKAAKPVESFVAGVGKGALGGAGYGAVYGLGAGEADLTKGEFGQAAGEMVEGGEMGAKLGAGIGAGIGVVKGTGQYLSTIPYIKDLIKTFKYRKQGADLLKPVEEIENDIRAELNYFKEIADQPGRQLAKEKAGALGTATEAGVQYNAEAALLNGYNKVSEVLQRDPTNSEALALKNTIEGLLKGKTTKTLTPRTPEEIAAMEGKVAELEKSPFKGQTPEEFKLEPTPGERPVEQQLELPLKVKPEEVPVQPIEPNVQAMTSKAQNAEKLYTAKGPLPVEKIKQQEELAQLRKSELGKMADEEAGRAELLQKDQAELASGEDVVRLKQVEKLENIQDKLRDEQSKLDSVADAERFQSYQKRLDEAEVLKQRLQSRYETVETSTGPKTSFTPLEADAFVKRIRTMTPAATKESTEASRIALDLVKDFNSGMAKVISPELNEKLSAGMSFRKILYGNELPPHTVVDLHKELNSFVQKVVSYVEAGEGSITSRADIKEAMQQLGILSPKIAQIMDSGLRDAADRLRLSKALQAHIIASTDPSKSLATGGGIGLRSAYSLGSVAKKVGDVATSLPHLVSKVVNYAPEEIAMLVNKGLKNLGNGFKEYSDILLKARSLPEGQRRSILFGLMQKPDFREQLRQIQEEPAE